MFSNIDKLINENMRTQREIRTRDERIVALETENAMLYLKLAQFQRNLRTTKQESSYHQYVNEEDEKFRFSLKGKLLHAHEQVNSLQSELKMMKLEVKEFLKNNAKPGTMFSRVGEDRGFSSLLHNIKDTQNTDVEALNLKLMQAEQERDEAERRSNMERSRRRTLHNTLIELRGNIRVHCRVRPLLATLDSNSHEDLLGIAGTQSEKIVQVMDEETISFNQINNSNNALNKSRLFEYERVYRPEDNQDSVFNDVAPLLTSLLDGYNVCIMAYGQTGSGKTHTMVGDHSIYGDVSPDDLTQECKKGIIPRAAKELTRLMKEREMTSEKFALEISVFEVYNNEIIDLLSSDSQRDVKHTVFSASDGSQEIPSLTARKVTSAEEVMDYVTYGMTHRHEDSTQIHSHSSRSHLIVQLNIYQTNTTFAANSAEQTDAGRKNTTLSSTDVRSAHARSRSPGARHSRSYLPVKRNTTPKKSNNEEFRSPPSPSQPHLSSNARSFSVKTKLQLVDLAGSESVGMSGVTGSAFRETSNINKSLSALADVLQALSENQNHIPYRNTKLTHILQDTIGGDSKLLVMLCVSPVQKYTTETLQCLGFGSRTRQVARGPAKKRRPTGCHLNIPSPISDSTSTRSSARRC